MEVSARRPVALPETTDLAELLRAASLTRAEAEVVGLLVKGWSVGQIALNLCLKESTVQQYTCRATRKLREMRQEFEWRTGEITDFIDDVMPDVAMVE